MTAEPQQSAGTQRGGIPVDSFANRLMLARAHAGHLSIREAAELCDLGRGAWTNWEKGTLPGDIIEVATIVAEKLQVDREWLLFGGQLGRQEGRTVRRGRGSQGIPRYLDLTVRPDRPHDNRPAGHPRADATNGATRTARLPRGRRPRG
jgi:hypothetical protein